MTIATVNKASGWMDTINSNFKNIITDTGWQSDGITYLNGIIKDETDPIEYRVLNFGGVVLFFLKGYIGNLKFKAGQYNVAKFPTTLNQYNDDVNYHVGSVLTRWTFDGNENHIRMDLQTDGTLRLWPMVDLSGGSIYVDSAYLATKNN